MNYPKEIFVKDYFEIHEYYSQIYGRNRTIILMQVGAFHECYATDDIGIDIVSLSQQLDITCTKKNGNLPLSKSNPRMMGFPVYTTRNFIDKLIDINYTIILINQSPNDPKKRELSEIFSPATYIEKKTNKSFYLVSIVLDKIKESKTNIYNFCIGLSAYDLSTGLGSVYECYSNSNDKMAGLDDALRFLENYPPREIILQNNLSDDMGVGNMKVNEVLNYLNIAIENTYTIKINQHNKIEYQKKLLQKIYNIDINLDIINYLGLMYLNWGRLSLIILLDYAMNHQPRLLDHLRKPNIFTNDKYLYLGNRSLEQLDVNTNMDTNLFNVINFTKTAIGKRFLNSQLVMPIIDINELNSRYNCIEMLISKNITNMIINKLEDIYDLDKIIRKLEINIINPYELHHLYLSFYQINKLVMYMKDEKILKYFNIDKNISIECINKFITVIESKFILEKINGLNFNNFTESDYSFYNSSIHPTIDAIMEQIDSNQNFITNLITKLESFIEDKIYFKKKKDDNVSDEKSLITLKFNDRDGHYLLITNRRCDILRKNLEKIKKLKIGMIEIDINDLEFTPLPKSSNTKINCKKIKEISLELVTHKNNMAKLLKETFRSDMIEIFKSFGESLHCWSNKIAYIDFITSGATAAIINHYSKPTINSKSGSYFIAKELRHPIIEKISTDTTYIPHDIELGFETKQDGILLYGINSSGKSTLMKSIGLNIILAQIGYYTASTSFTYSPYTSLFTRICGNDNMFKGMSSFMVEMMELMAILKRNDKNTLVIGDEICRGTEEKSANIIVCYMLETLANKESSFITATHLHRIASLESVKRLNRIQSKHLKITYDSINDILIYDRNLSDGIGETFYGLQVAKFMMKDNNFNIRTSEILQEYENTSIKQSKYNPKVFLSECLICKSKEKLETHHIVWQKEFDMNEINKNKFYLQKNDASNLAILCSECHDKVDRNEIIINGWKETSNGNVFDYMVVEPVKKSKHSDEFIQYIKKLKKVVKSDEKMARIKIKEEHNKRVSTKTIISIWNS